MSGVIAGQEAPRGPREALRRELTLASGGVLLALAVVKHLAALVPPLAPYAGTLAAALQLYVPLHVSDRVEPLDRAALGLEPSRPGRDAALALGLLALTIVPFAIGHHAWQALVMHRTFVPRAPDGMLEFTIVQLLVVALPEELYFRGFLQARFATWFAGRGADDPAPADSSPVRAIVAASAVFALAHFVGEYNPARLGPFFPGLVFGWLRVRTGALVAPVVYHAGCNVLAQALWASYS
jgi:membrane protease YdiL (CAAX protease family)